MLGVRVPDELHRRVRSHAALTGTSVQNMVIELLEKTVGKDGRGKTR